MSKNIVPKDFYVYEHLTPKGEVFYVGKGSGDRAWSNWRNDYWHNIVGQQGGFTVRIVEDGLQEWYALELESLLITYYGQRVNKDGPLANLTSGGIGFSQCDATKAKLSIIAKKQFEDPIKRKTHSEAVKIANAKPEYIQKQRLAKLGKKLTEEHIKASTSAMRITKCKDIICLETGMTFKTSYEALDWLKSVGKEKARANKVLAVCQNIRAKAYGYTWKYVVQSV